MLQDIVYQQGSMFLKNLIKRPSLCKVEFAWKKCSALLNSLTFIVSSIRIALLSDISVGSMVERLIKYSLRYVASSPILRF